MQREDVYGQKMVVMHIQNKQESVIDVPETSVRLNVSPKKLRVLTWSTPIETTMGNKEVELSLKRKDHVYYENEDNKTGDQTVVRHELGGLEKNYTGTCGPLSTT